MNDFPEVDLRLNLPLDRFALQVDLRFGDRVIGWYGPSGSGKTTLLECIAGLRKPSLGYLRFGAEVWLDTAKRIALPPERRGIGYVPQGGHLFPHWTVAQNLAAGKRRAMQRGFDFAKVLEETIAVLQLEPLLSRRTALLSGGERQRVALGRALCSGPSLLLLDEPLAALDSTLRHRILPFLRRVRESFNLPIFIVSHQPVELQALCDRVFALRAGEVIAQGSPAELFAQPKVYPMARAGGRFENLLPAVILTHRDRTTELALGHRDGPRIRALHLERPASQTAILSLAANDIILARIHPEGLSARNCLPATLAELRQADGLDYAVLELAGLESHPVLAELTDTAVADLGLHPGQTLWAIFKSSALSVAG